MRVKQEVEQPALLRTGLIHVILSLIPRPFRAIFAWIKAFLFGQEEEMRRLPFGKAAFEELIARMRASLPEGLTIDDKSLRFTIASMIMEYPARKSMHYESGMLHAIIKAAANEIAWSEINELKKQQQLESEKIKQQAAQLTQISQAQAGQLPSA